jgi:predicted Fe-Mo cluster-binding NifX family protein
MKLEELALSGRIYDLLCASGYETVGDLMFQLALHEDTVLGISGIGPKAMEEIKEKLAGISFPTPQPKEVQEAVVELVEAELEVPVEISLPVTQELEVPGRVEELAEAVVFQHTPVDETTTTLESVSNEPEIIGEGQAPVVNGEGIEETEKPVDFNEIFTLRPETLVIVDADGEEDEEDLDQKGKTKKKKKKKFVEVVYDPDRDITLVNRKRKRGGDWKDDWTV